MVRCFWQYTFISRGLGQNRVYSRNSIGDVIAYCRDFHIPLPTSWQLLYSMASFTALVMECAYGNPVYQYVGLSPLLFTPVLPSHSLYSHRMSFNMVQNTRSLGAPQADQLRGSHAKLAERLASDRGHTQNANPLIWHSPLLPP